MVKCVFSLAAARFSLLRAFGLSLSLSFPPYPRNVLPTFNQLVVWFIQCVVNVKRCCVRVAPPVAYDIQEGFLSPLSPGKPLKPPARPSLRFS
jgi:hypothetical protein